VSYNSLKRVFDFISSLSALVFLSPFLLIVSILIKLDSKGPIFFRQKRIGKDGRIFRIYKFRTMVQNAEKIGDKITKGNDPRITKIGKILRRYEIDEIPTLINVLKGEMSIVGPRPEIPKFLQYYSGKYRKILSVRPGMTDLGTLKFRDEAKYLKNGNAEETYIKRILPKKLNLYLEYVNNMGFIYDLKIIFKTFSLIFRQKKI